MPLSSARPYDTRQRTTVHPVVHCSPTYPRNLQAQPGTVGVLRLEEGNRADVTLDDLKTLLPALTIQLR